jgi:hypothetical protein
MEDATGPSVTTKPVNHVTYDFESYSASTWKYHSGSDVVEDEGPNAVWWGHGFYPSYSTFPTNMNRWKPRFEVSLERQLADTIEKFHTTNEVDNLLNIAEAHQIPSALESLLTTVGTGQVRAALRKTPSSGSLASRLTKGGKVLGQKLSNSYLAWSFGLAPLMSDMKKMSTACKNLHSDLQRDFNRKSRIDSVTTKVYGGPADLVDLGSSLFEMQSFCPRPPIRICGVKGIRTQQYNTEVFHRLDYLLRKFGSPGPASFVWEKIPYSFVVDWFLNVKGITQELDNLLTGNTKNISDAWYSLDYEEFYRLNFKNPNAIIPPVGSTLASNRIRTYTRTPISAQRPAVFVDVRFGKKQLALTGALLYQKVASRR